MADQIDVDKLGSSLAERLGQILGRTQKADDDGDEYGARPRSVPYDRLQREIDRRKALEADLADVGGRLAALQQGYEARVAKLQEETATQLKSIGQRHQEDIALIDSGLTDAMGRQVVRQAWEGLPKEGRAKSPTEWWQQTVAAHSAHLADPERAAAPDVPRPLTPYLPAPAADAKASAVAQTPRQPSPPAARQSASLASLPNDDIGGFLEGLRRMG